MYRAIREFHLWIALALALLLTMYAGTGVLMLHGTGLPNAPTRSVRTAELPADLLLPPAEAPGEVERFASEVGRALGLRGRSGPLKLLDDGGWSVQYRRPGTRETVAGQPDQAGVEVTVVRNGPITTLDELHEQRGYIGGPLYFMWALIVDLVSIGLVLFAVTGTVLWWILKRDWLGGVLLGGSLVGTLAGIVWQMLRA